MPWRLLSALCYCLSLNANLLAEAPPPIAISYCGGFAERHGSAGGRSVKESAFCRILCESQAGAGGGLYYATGTDYYSPWTGFHMVCRGLEKEVVEHLTSAQFAEFLPQLISLEIQISFLPRLTRNLVGRMGNLRRLILRGNRIKSVANDALGGLPHLTTLDLGYNHLSYFSPELFANTTRLDNLTLSGNELLNLHPKSRLQEMLAPVGRSLRHLYLDDMRMETIPSNYLYHLTSLVTLSLCRNQIRELNFINFVDLKFARGKFRVHYHFRDNQIEYVEPTTFLVHSIPLVLDLRNNQIKDISFLYKRLDRCHWEKSTINLHGNPLLCDCALYNFTLAKTASAIIAGRCSNRPYKNLLIYGWEASGWDRGGFFEPKAAERCPPPEDLPRAVQPGETTTPPPVTPVAAATTRSTRQFQFQCRCNNWRRVDQYFDKHCMPLQRIPEKRDAPFVSESRCEDRVGAAPCSAHRAVVFLWSLLLLFILTMQLL